MRNVPAGYHQLPVHYLSRDAGDDVVVCGREVSGLLLLCETRFHNPMLLVVEHKSQWEERVGFVELDGSLSDRLPWTRRTVRLG